MNSEMEYDEFVKIFREKIVNIFELSEGGDENGIYLHHYEHYYYVNNRRCVMDFVVRDPNISLGEELLVKYWISHCYTSRDNPNEIFKFVYENILLSDLDLYIKIAIHVSFFTGGNNKQIATKLIKFHKKIPNLNIDEFMDEYYRYSFSFYGNLTGHWYIFKGTIIKLNNDKISNLWWLWKDYSGDYVNYIEWLPRETLEDLIMIENKGKYMPDYSTYIKV